VQAIFQEPALALNPRLKVSEHVTEGLLAHGLAPDLPSAIALTRPFFDALGLNPALLQRFPQELSASERQLVLIVRALSLEPSLVVCDEPFALLDPEARERSLELFERERTRLEQSQVVVSPDPAVVERLSRRTAVLHLGRIMELGLQCFEFFFEFLMPISKCAQNGGHGRC
jgi:ABC-type glutathione transport system ATPase component